MLDTDEIIYNESKTAELHQLQIESLRYSMKTFKVISFSGDESLPNLVTKICTNFGPFVSYISMRSLQYISKFNLHPVCIGICTHQLLKYESFTFKAFDEIDTSSIRYVQIFETTVANLGSGAEFLDDEKWVLEMINKFPNLEKFSIFGHHSIDAAQKEFPYIHKFEDMLLLGADDNNDPGHNIEEKYAIGRPYISLL